jgi:hypothetical protein
MFENWNPRYIGIVERLGTVIQNWAESFMWYSEALRSLCIMTKDDQQQLNELKLKKVVNITFSFG